MATMPSGTWVAVTFVVGCDIVCVVLSGCHLLSPSHGLLHSWLLRLVFPNWYVPHPQALRTLSAPGRVIEKY